MSDADRPLPVDKLRDEHLYRLQAMVDDMPGGKWDLSPNDIAAIQWALDALSAAERRVEWLELELETQRDITDREVRRAETAERDAYERAAKVCESDKTATGTMREPCDSLDAWFKGYRAARWECAAAIRALSQQQP